MIITEPQTDYHDSCDVSVVTWLINCCTYIDNLCFGSVLSGFQLKYINAYQCMYDITWSVVLWCYRPFLVWIYLWMMQHYHVSRLSVTNCFLVCIALYLPVKMHLDRFHISKLDGSNGYILLFIWQSTQNRSFNKYKLI